ncbi:MAG TPA: S-methyl-5-thioribose kinase [Chthoniobacterales bacterium]|nr:S-methyl-5-thioribose kinase [Chthoniobacterales bacterium]
MEILEPYFPLANSSIPEFLEDVPEIERLLGSDRSQWISREVGDGNLNAVYIVCGEAGSLVVKQALPYLRLVGEAWPLPLERSYFEYLALTEEAVHAGNLVPKIYHFDKAMAAIVMEYLSPHIILRKGFIRGLVYPRLAEDLAEFAAQTLFKTSDLYLPAATKKARLQIFCANTELCKITEDLVFTDPYRPAKLNRWTSPELDATAASFRRDTELKMAVQRLKFKFLSSAEALIHGDLHSGSVMVTPEDTRMIDPEFAFYGPMGFDVGALIGNLLLAYFSQTGHESAPGMRDEYREWLLTLIEKFWNGFSSRFLGLWATNPLGDAFTGMLFESPDERCAIEAERHRFVSHLFEDSLRFAGTKMIRRILGLAHVEDLESIGNRSVRAACELKALVLARKLVLEAPSFGQINLVTAAARAIQENR